VDGKLLGVGIFWDNADPERLLVICRIAEQVVATPIILRQGLMPGFDREDPTFSK
jgi:hypothetical protein